MMRAQRVLAQRELATTQRLHVSLPASLHSLPSDLCEGFRR